MSMVSSKASVLNSGASWNPAPSKLRVGISVTSDETGYRAHAQRGTGRYVRELLHYFDGHSDSGIEVSPFPIDHALGSPVLDRAVDMLPAGRATVKKQILAPVRLASRRTEQVDLLHFPAHIDAPSWCKKRYIVTVLDLIPVVLSDMYKADKPSWRFRLARQLELMAIKNASLVLAISENTARDVHQVLGIPYERIVVTPLGVRDEFFFFFYAGPEEELRSRYGIPSDRPIILYVGGIDQRKNVQGMFRALALLLERYRERGVPQEKLPLLVMSGSIQQDAEYPKLVALLKELYLERHIVTPGFVPDKDLIQLYHASSVFFFPSLYEGFGLPPLEAMAAGLPVVSSNASCLPEVIGNAGLSFDPNDVSHASELLNEVLTNFDLSARLSEAGREQARKFTWQRTGELTLSAYRQLSD